MRLSYSLDARTDLRDRGIRRRDVRNALRHQIDERPGNNRWKPTVVITGPSMTGRSLCVVLDEKNRNRVVSVFWPNG
jgi:hypothetical protein